MLNLDGRELYPAVALGDVVHLDELPGTYIGGTDVPDFARVNEVVQGLHSFLHGRVGVSCMDLKEIDVVGAKSRQTTIDLVKDRRARKATLIDVVAGVCKLGAEVTRDEAGLVLGDKKPDLGHDNQFVSGDVVLRKCQVNDPGARTRQYSVYLFDELPDDSFRVSVRVHIGGINRGNTIVPGGFQQCESLQHAGGQ